nr:sister chromatid cohesion protein pds5-like [Ipomoea batatas]
MRIMASAAPLPSQKELEQMLIQSGIELSTPPSSTAELLSLLEKVESELKSIGQDPLESTRNVLEPIKKALIERKLLRHSDKIIEVSVASCICEIIRIFAPVLPYHNTEMEVIFHQIIASLEKLHYVDSDYYSKALRVLEAVAKYKLGVRLLDFDYVLAVNVFQLFLKIISLKHTNAALRDMVDIMSQLIEERDEVSIDFQVSILDSLRKRTLATTPCSTLLGKEVLEKCHARLKPCLLQLMTDMNMNLDDYCNVLGSVLHEVPEG